MANSLILNSAYYIFRNLSIIAYIIEIQKSKFVVFNELTNLSQVAKLSSVYIFILQGRFTVCRQFGERVTWTGFKIDLFYCC